MSTYNWGCNPLTIRGMSHQVLSWFSVIYGFMMMGNSLVSTLGCLRKTWWKFRAEHRCKKWGNDSTWRVWMGGFHRWGLSNKGWLITDNTIQIIRWNRALDFFRKPSNIFTLRIQWNSETVAEWGSMRVNSCSSNFHSEVILAIMVCLWKGETTS